jgi:hypothetical protein
MKRLAIFGSITLLISCTFVAQTVQAQTSRDDSAYYEKAVANTIAIYHRNVGDQSGLFNGRQYAGYPYSFQLGGFPFFLTNETGKGSIVYDSVLYDDVQLRYDEVAELVIFQDTKHQIQLNTDKVSRFSIEGNNFIRVEKDDSLSNSIFRTGFYNLLYDGKVQAVKKEVKVIREELRSNTEGILRFVDISTYYYIKKNNEYFPVKNRSAILDIFKDRKKEILQYIKANKLKFRKDRDNTIIKVSAWYDQLTK